MSLTEEEHPCQSLMKGGTVCKVDENGDVYCATPNACGIVHEEPGFTRMLETILTSRVTFRREGDTLIPIDKQTRRIPLDKWNSFRYLSCCVEGAGASIAGYPLYRWLTNVPELNVIVEQRKRK
jgi:hypothetical protein